MKVKGYYNLKEMIFLGPITATSHNGVAYTPRYVENVCFGEYDTETDVFVPLTNPYRIEGFALFDEDEEAFKNGQYKMNVLDGLVEDKGSDIKRKKVYGNTKKTKPKPRGNVVGKQISRNNKVKIDAKPNTDMKEQISKIKLGSLFK